MRLGAQQLKRRNIKSNIKLVFCISVYSPIHGPSFNKHKTIDI